jgi:pimeloyl-ACP methyl ester carboxylesterase
MANPLLATLQRPLLRRRNAHRLIIDSPRGIHEQRFLTINGCQQWVTIRGQDRANPILLVLHGGPGSSYMPFNSWLTAWEKYFTMVQWDQPGAGRTFQHNDHAHPVELSIDQLAADGIELTRQLRDLLDGSPVILLGSSVGSLVGLQMVRRRPEMFCGYVGVNQNSPRCDPAVYRLTRQAARQQSDRKGLRLLESMGADPGRWTIHQHEHLMKHAIRLTKGVPDMVYDLMLPALMFAPSYTMNDIRDHQRAMAYSNRQLFSQLRAYDQRTPHDQFAIPIFFFLGERDIITPVAPARSYLEHIGAPHKELVIIPHAGHLAEFANPTHVLHQLLTRVRPLSTPSAPAAS